MPEYSSTTITPADGVQVPSMNGSTSGNFALSALRDYILASKGQANGLASLGSDGKLTASQLPDLADDVIVVASYAVLPATGTAGKIYITADNNKMYRWDSDEADYVELSVDLSEYAKLTDLAAEESAREAADANLNNALTAIDHRVQNLEQAKGSYVVQNYKDGSITPSGKGNWAIVEGLRGVSRVENNLAVNGNFATGDMTGWTDISGGTTTIANNKISYSWSANYSNNGLANSATRQAGHTYLIFATVKNTGAETRGFRVGQPYGVQSETMQIASGATALVCGVVTPTTVSGAGFHFGLFGTQTASYSCEMTDFVVTDLSVYFGGTIPSDADTIAEIQTNYPHLLIPSDYGVRIVDSSYSGVRAEGVNIWDEEWELGAIDDTTGEKTSSSTRIRSKNYISVTPNTSYYFKVTGALIVFGYDANKNAVKLGDNTMYAVGSNNAITTPSNVSYLLFYTGSNSYGTTYNHDFQICLNSYTDKTTYHPYMESTLSLTFTGKSAGSVAEMYYPETGEQTKPLRTITLNGSENWYEYTGTGSGYTGAALNVGETAKSRTDIINNRGFLPQATPSDSTQRGITTINTQLYVTFSTTEYATWSAFVASLASNPLVATYALATPNPSTFVTPIIDNTLLTEGGGRLSTVQTGTVVDGSFDMGFITL